MNLIQSAISSNKNTEQAIAEVVQKMHQNPTLVLFFTSTIHHFETVTKLFHEKYPNSEVVGVTTTGEIGPEGFSESSLVAQSYSSQFGKVSAYLMDNIVKYPVFDRKNLLAAASKIGIHTSSARPQDEGVALVFPTGLGAGEEKMLSIVNSIFTNEGFPIFGGTAGDDAKFEKTYVSLNGKLSDQGGIVIFLKPTVQFKIIKENIFKGTGKVAKITKADVEKRIVYEIDYKPAATAYAQLLNVPQKDLANYFMSNPIGRRFNDEIFIASPFRIIENGAIEFYCQVFEGSIVELLEPQDAVVTLQHTLHTFTNDFKEIEGVIACNCILRKLQFQNQRLFPMLNSQLKTLPQLVGFCSYGEQWNKSLINQTLVMIGFGTLK